MDDLNSVATKGKPVMRPLLSIVVPTRNRIFCAEHLINYILKFNEDFELIICDNSDVDDLKKIISQKLNDVRLKYSYSNEKLSVVDNFNQALAKSNGEYVLFLGDDDLISPRLFKYVKSLKSRQVDAVLFGRQKSVIHFFWPGVKAAHWGDIGGKLFFSNFSGSEQPVNLQNVIRHANLHLGTGPREMPRAYLGIISRNVAQQVQQKYGALFGGVSPDVYSSHLISSIAKKVIRLDYPMIIPGATPASTSAQRAERSDVGDIKANDHTGRFKDIDWHSQIPQYYAPYTVWALSLYQATLKTHHFISQSGFSHLYAQCLIFTRGHGREIFKAMRSGRTKILLFFCLCLTTIKMIQILFSYFLDKVPALIRQKPGGANYELKDFLFIGDAVDQMEKQLSYVEITTVTEKL